MGMDHLPRNIAARPDRGAKGKTIGLKMTPINLNLEQSIQTVSGLETRQNQGRNGVFQVITRWHRGISPVTAPKPRGAVANH